MLDELGEHVFGALGAIHGALVETGVDLFREGLREGGAVELERLWSGVEVVEAGVT